MSKRITIEGSSIDESVFNKVSDYSKFFLKNDFFRLKAYHDHVHKELELYSQLVSRNSYIIVFDTTMNIFDNKIIKEISNNYKYKPWGKNSNPHSAVHQFLKKNNKFKIDKSLDEKALITNCFEGFLKKIK